MKFEIDERELDFYCHLWSRQESDIRRSGEEGWRVVRIKERWRLIKGRGRGREESSGSRGWKKLRKEEVEELRKEEEGGRGMRKSYAEWEGRRS